MPFVALAGSDPDPTTPMKSVQLEHLPSTRWLRVFARTLWRQIEGVAYLLPDDVDYPSRLTRSSPPRSQWVAPPHGDDESTDLASVPPWLWGVIASFGRHTMPALVHDRLCREADEAADTGRRDEAARLRWEADWMFRVGLTEQEVPWAQRWVMWAAVRLFGAASLEPTGKLAVGAALVGMITTALAALGVLGVTWRFTPPPIDVVSRMGATVGVTLGLLIGALVAVRRRDLAGATIVATLAGPIAVPALLVSLGSTVLLWLPTGLLWTLRKILYVLGGMIDWLANRIGRSTPRPPDPGRVPPMGSMNA